MQTEDDISSVDGIPVMTEAIGFSADEMVACPNCAKQNPPNRLNCFYCGTALGLPDDVAAGIQFRPAEIEDWEPGVNVVSVSGIGHGAVESIGATLALEDELLSSLASVEPPVPLVRVRAEDAEEVTARLSSSGFQSVQVRDESLHLDQTPARLKEIIFDNDSVELVLFNSDEVARIDAADVTLIVSGAIFKSSSESTLKKKRKETKHVDERFDGSDHEVIDLYLANDRRGFRVFPHGFDFSCLGDRKSLLAVENIKTLKELMRATFSNAVFDDSYLSKLTVLDHVWPRTVTNTSKGMQRVGWRLERSVGESVSNEEQFTRYSRMRRELI